MRSLASLDTEVLVIGHGISGLSVAIFLAGRGKVTVVGSGTPWTAFSTSCFALPRETDEASKKALSFLKPRLEDAGLPLKGEVDRKLEVVTNLGSRLPCCLVPEFSALKTKDDPVVLGIVGHPDVESELVCANLRSSGMGAKPLWAKLLAGDKASSAVQFSQRLDEAALLDIADILESIPEETVFIPPLFPLKTYARSMSFLQNQKEVGELATPLSLPGLRFQEAMESVSSSEGVRLLREREATSIQLDGEEAGSALLTSGLRKQRIDFSHLVLASGDITLSGARSSHLTPFRLSEQAASNKLRQALASGIESHGLQALSREGRVLRNVFVCGAANPGNNFALGSGMMGAIRSSWKVSRLILGGA